MTTRAEGMETSKQSVNRHWGAAVTLAVAFVLSGLSMLGAMQIEQTLKEGGWTVTGSGPAIVTEGLSEGVRGAWPHKCDPRGDRHPVRGGR